MLIKYSTPQIRAYSCGEVFIARFVIHGPRGTICLHIENDSRVTGYGLTMVYGAETAAEPTVAEAHRFTTQALDHYIQEWTLQLPWQTVTLNKSSFPPTHEDKKAQKLIERLILNRDLHRLSVVAATPLRI
jgi:hypothetical protein